MWASQPTPDSPSPTLSLRGACLIWTFVPQDSAPEGGEEWKLLTGRPGAPVWHSHSGNNLPALHIGRRGLGTKHPFIAQQSALPSGGTHTPVGSAP